MSFRRRLKFKNIDLSDLSMVDINGNPLSSRNTANCYVIHEAGTYMFPAVYGNAIKDGATNSVSYTQPFYNYLNNLITSPYIETDTGNKIMSASMLWIDQLDYLIPEITLKTIDNCTFIVVKVTKIPETGGNALIAVKDEQDRIMWSWHLWAYPFTLTTKRYTNTNGYSYDLLDVNLGWVKDDLNSKYGTCTTYQWGRKDPMLRGDSQGVNSNPVYQGTWTITTTATTVSFAIQNPNAFCKAPTNLDSWWRKNGSQVHFRNYWDAVKTDETYTDIKPIKTVYDPCPVNFSVPNVNAFVGFTASSGGTWDKGYTWGGRYFSMTNRRERYTGNLGQSALYFTGLQKLNGSMYGYCICYYLNSDGPKSGFSAQAFSGIICPILNP